jgi:phosphoglycerate dehydrogenase-like enzyme
VELPSPETAARALTGIQTSWSVCSRGALAGGPGLADPSRVLTPVETMLHLRSLPIFDGLTTRQLMDLALVVGEEDHAAGATVVREGEFSDGLYLVVDGRVQISKGGRPLSELGPRSFFGEIAIFEGAARSATAQAVVRTRLLRLGRAELLRLMEEFPGIAIGVCQNLSRRVRELSKKCSTEAWLARLDPGGDGSRRATPRPGARRAGRALRRCAQINRPEVDDVEAAFFSGDLYPERTREFVMAVVRAKRLRWFQLFGAGVDHPFFQGLLERGIRLTTASGASAVPIAQTVALFLLAFSRDLRRWLDAQERRAWEPRPVGDLQGQVLGVVGLGPIGLEMARLGLALRMRVIGVRRTPRGDEPCETLPLSRLHELLAVADALVLAAPLTEETRGLIGAAELAQLKPDAVLVNVARGALVDEAALLAALEAGRLAGAYLDVFEQEPLPQTSRLWSLPNVFVTPHASGQTAGNDERAAAIFIENLARYHRGEALLNEVLRR